MPYVGGGVEGTALDTSGPEITQIRLDHDRIRRRGYAVAVVCEPKSADQVANIAAEVAASASTGDQTMATRGNRYAVQGSFWLNPGRWTSGVRYVRYR